MHFVLPTSGLDLPCAVPNFTGIPVVIAQPAYSVGLYPTDHAGLEIYVNSCIAWPFSRQIAIGNAGPTTALESMGAKLSFRCHSLKGSVSSVSLCHFGSLIRYVF